MKNFTLIVLLLFVVKSIVAKECKSDSDCSKDQCCASKGLKATKNCQDRLKTNELCIQGTDSNHDIHYFLCPCQAGLTCLPSAYEELPYFGRVAVNARCKASVGEESSSAKPVTKQNADDSHSDGKAETAVESKAETAVESKAESSADA